MAAILIIDDEELVRYSVRKVLDRLGHEITEAENGAEGLALINQQPFDLIITDIIMPEKEGIETITELRRTHPNLKIIVISGGGRTGKKDYLRMASRLGARHTLAKPFRAEALIEAVDDCLQAGEVTP